VGLPVKQIHCLSPLRLLADQPVEVEVAVVGTPALALVPALVVPVPALEVVVK